MIKNYKTKLLGILFCIISTVAAAQTTGSSDLESIEYKDRLITQNDKKVAELNREHLESYSLEQEKLAKLKKELNDLIAEKIAVLDDYRRGQFCTGCSKPRSQFAPGEAFPHSGQQVRPATPQELAAKEKEYDDKINAKQASLDKFQKEENEFARKRADLSKQMDILKASSDKLREEIVALSKSYRDKVVAQGKSTQSVWIGDLMHVVANKHIIEDKTDILKVKQGDLVAEEAKAIAASNEKVRLQNEANINTPRNTVAQRTAQLSAANQTFQQDATTLNQEIAKHNSRLTQTNDQLARPGQSQQDIDKLTQEKTGIAADLADAKNRLSNLDNNYKKQTEAIKNEIRTNNDKIRDLTLNLAKYQAAALVTIRQVFALKRKTLGDALVARKEILQQTGDLLITKKADYRKRFLEYADIVDRERIRLVRACSSSGASCYGIDTHGTVVQNWNKSSGCVGQMENNRAIGVYYGCEEEAAIYKSHYTAQLNGLSDDDLSALKRKVSKTRYDMIYQKVID
jgi:DNA repair exonuclease SbcCD ATPase subunit